MKVKLIQVGGFFGAGKTTFVLRLARWLVERCHRVAIVADEPIDLAEAQAEQPETFSIDGMPLGSCFFCRPNNLTEIICKLGRMSRPDIIIVEIAGRRKDLNGIVRRLEGVYKKGVQCAPYSVVVDPFNMLSTLKLETSRGFSREIESLMKTQLEEASILLLNKCDVFPIENRRRMEAVISDQYPGSKVYSVSGRTGEGSRKWFDLLANEVVNPGCASGAHHEKAKAKRRSRTPK